MQTSSQICKETPNQFSITSLPNAQIMLMRFCDLNLLSTSKPTHYGSFITQDNRIGGVL